MKSILVRLAIIVSFLYFEAQATLQKRKTCEECKTVEGYIANLTFTQPSQAAIQQELAKMQVTLHPTGETTQPNGQGKFIFYDVKPGTYRLEVFSPTFTFDPIFVEVSDRISRSRSDISAYSANPFTKKRIPLDHPIRVTALGRTPYFEIKEEMSIVGMMKSSYGIMILMTVVMLWCAKKMPSMDEIQNAEQPARENAPNPSIQQQARRAQR